MSDYAVTADGRVVTIDEVRTMSALPELFCDGATPDELPCAAPVRPRALTSEIQRPHFYGRHRPGCAQGTDASESVPGDAGRDVARQLLAPVWKVIRQDRTDAVVPTGRRRPDAETPGTRTWRSVPDSREGLSDSPHRRSPVALLKYVRTGNSLEGISIEVSPGAQRPAQEVILHVAEAARERREDQVTWIWGEITGCRPTRFEGLMCKFRDAADDLAVLLKEEQVHRFPAADAETLVGRHIIASGVFKDTDRGPYLKVESHLDMAFHPLLRKRRSEKAGG